MTKTLTIYIFKYSPASIVVLGSTKPIKDRLKAIGGGFNPRLTHPLTKERVSGWVFSLKREQLIREACQNAVKDNIIARVESHIADNICETRHNIICDDPGKIASENFCIINNI